LVNIKYGKKKSRIWLLTLALDINKNSKNETNILSKKNIRRINTSQKESMKMKMMTTIKRRVIAKITSQ
jgi:hypothetical protein